MNTSSEEITVSYDITFNDDVSMFYQFFIGTHHNSPYDVQFYLLTKSDIFWTLFLPNKNVMEAKQNKNIMAKGHFSEVGIVTFLNYLSQSQIHFDKSFTR